MDDKEIIFTALRRYHIELTNEDEVQNCYTIQKLEILLEKHKLK